MYLHICPCQHYFGCVPQLLICCILIFIKFNAFFESSSGTHRLFRSRLFSSKYLKTFPVIFYLLISGWISLCSDLEYPLYNSILSNLLRFYALGWHLSWYISGGAKKCVFGYCLMSQYYPQ